MFRRLLLFGSALLPLCAQSFVEGTVIESVSKTPVLDATVQIRYTKPPNGVSSMSVQNTGPSTQTDGAGRFRIEVASPSEFLFVIGKDGYSPVDSSDSPVIVLTKGESKRGVVLTLATACAVEGRVFDPELDKPVAHLAVVIQKFMSFEGVKTFIPAGRTMTDDDGKYRYASLSPGRYRLIIGPSQQPRMRPPDAGAEPLMIYPATYFPDSTSESGAMMIDLLPGAQQAGLDFRLKRSKAGRVRVKTARHQREASLWSACSGCPRA